ncbi:kinase [Vibrio sp. 10N.286.49.C2]|uniref:PfkB family carbohydrate kinase n=1 Tax=unclassified Vibrio TaxID=2614977 RepID=UPI000C847286|nr:MULTISPECIES: PfkB family carbohydrate kinase [unclassified Vibrio]PMH31488.1 kinase [Vibrio sp. 10N.286.49.C2]PMH50509.1 kinase [Vibrio sp. 10N.286.49.B1]PMH78009.1 kinase [Vibrio sp. 10N.286.48.B7]
MTDREQQVLALIKQDPMIAQQKLAQQLGLSRSAVAGHIMNLTRKGFIQGKGYVIAPDRYAAVVGGANMDLCGRSNAELVIGDSNPGALTSSAGGVARNIADNMSRLGSHVQFIGAIGDDSWGEQLKVSCRDAGMGIDHLLTVTGKATSTYLSIHDPSGELQLALNDMSLIDELTGAQMAKRANVLNFSSAIVLDANLSDSALDYIFHAHSDKAIFVDPVSTVKANKIAPYLNHIHTLKPNLAEAELLADYSLPSLDFLPELANKLHHQGVKRLLISLGQQGAFASCEDHSMLISAVEAEVINVTGAGDALMGGIAHGFIQGWDWPQSIDFALGAARLALQSSSTINSIMSEKAVTRLIKESTC